MVTLKRKGQRDPWGVPEELSRLFRITCSIRLPTHDVSDILFRGSICNVFQVFGIITTLAVSYCPGIWSRSQHKFMYLVKASTELSSRFRRILFVIPSGPGEDHVSRSWMAAHTSPSTMGCSMCSFSLPVCDFSCSSGLILIYLSQIAVIRSSSDPSNRSSKMLRLCFWVVLLLSGSIRQRRILKVFERPICVQCCRMCCTNFAS